MNAGTPNTEMENRFMNAAKFWAVCLCFALITPVYAQEEDHDDHDSADAHQEEDEHGEEQEEGGAIAISSEQQRTAGIVVEVLTPQTVVGEVAAPGEVQLNAYLTHKVSPRITAQVMQRHVKLGDQVTAGQPLLTLSSVEMAEAQGALQVAELEWQRVKSLGRDTVSAQRYTQVQVAQQQARARAKAYGMTTDQIDGLLVGNTASADGTFQLLAPQAGTVIRDAFVEGEFIEPGRELFEITDESQVWVEASLTPEEALNVRTDAVARVRVGDHWQEGRVVQTHHVLDEVTRTLAVRIALSNPEDRLHPGLFVDTRIAAGDVVEALAVPEDAVLRSPDGDWVVFVEKEPGEFEPQEVEVIRTVNGMTVIEGVLPGTRLVTQGAFFVQSELAKSGFEIHNH